MWRFVDSAGASWQAILGRESWGVLVALLVPDGPGAPRQAALTARAERDAHGELDALDAAGWQALLERSKPKT